MPMNLNESRISGGQRVEQNTLKEGYSFLALRNATSLQTRNVASE
jgi:hypothetical protein